MAVITSWGNGCVPPCERKIVALSMGRPPKKENVYFQALPGANEI